MNLFKEALAQKLRFKTIRGNILTEELWDIPLTSKNGFSLNDIAKDIYLELKQEVEIDFVGGTTSKNSEGNLKLEILKEIIKDKKEAIERKEQEASSKTHNQFIDALIAEKKNESLKSMSIEELIALRK